MARIIVTKFLEKSRMLKEYASWIYCGKCEHTIAYLCYSNYNNFKLDFKCKCGNTGSVNIALETDIAKFVPSNEKLLMKKNRFVCPNNNTPLFSFVEKNINSATCSIDCECCSKSYIQKVGENIEQ